MVAKPRKEAKELYDAIKKVSGFENWTDEKLRNYAEYVQYAGETMLFAGFIRFQVRRRDVFVGKSNL